MDDDVIELVLFLLNNSPISMAGHELAKIADTHARALVQVAAAAKSADDED